MAREDASLVYKTFWLVLCSAFILGYGFSKSSVVAAQAHVARGPWFMTYTSNDNDGVLNSLHILGLLQCGRLLCTHGSVMRR